MRQITRDQLKSKLDAGDDFTLIDVLSPEAYSTYHLPSAINIPLDEQFEQEIRRQVPDRHASMIVYCANIDCERSPKAAEKLMQMGYDNVFDYSAGKEDWKEANLPVETSAQA